MQFVTADGTQVGPPFVEKAIIRPYSSELVRLSGFEMRKRFYFGTDPTFNLLAVAQTKHGRVLCSLEIEVISFEMRAVLDNDRRFCTWSITAVL